jgi:hypothetical protein
MQSYVGRLTVGSVYGLYDPVNGRVYQLKFQKLHDEVEKKGDFYVSCADFTDRAGNKFDIDFMVLDDSGKFKVSQAIVHGINDEKRTYTLENFEP